MSAEYITIAGPVDTELEISRFRFLTRLERVSDEGEARSTIARVRAEHPRARHHCSAFVLGAAQRTRRSNDDGEPSGTAGAPMLDALVSAGLSDVIAVVTRYFGGVLLGAGGLTRAYRAAVAESVSQADRVRRAERIPALVTVEYALAPQIEAEARRRGIEVLEARYGATVEVRFLLALDQQDLARALVSEMSAGKATLTHEPSTLVDLPM
ncbi:IMPACT family protein [Leucobacter sp. W1153]|uniref:IMPACT family protein n=1 Tax=Leucobacter sp. W1153 TaxID=3439064 RepID=UPI003F2B0A20